MKLLYSNVIEQHVGWGAEWFMDKGFHTLGCTTHCIDYREHRDDLYYRFLQAPDCDAFLLQRGDSFPIPIIKAIHPPRFFWTSELFARCRDHDRLLKSNLFNHVFLRTPQCVDAVVTRGWLKPEQCSVLLSAFDDKFHRLLPNSIKNIDLLFLGSITPRRREFIEKLSNVCELTLANAFGEDMVNLLNRARIVLNIHADDYLDTETRVFEALGCGAFLLTERLSSENPFSEKDLVQFDSVDDLLDNVRYYLVHDQEREAIALHGHASALNGHTYMHRAQQIIAIISKFVIPDNGLARPTVKQSIGLFLYGISESIHRLVGRGRSLALALKKHTSL